MMQFKEGPEWLNDFKKKSFEKFESLEMPKEKEEEWRFTDISKFNILEKKISIPKIEIENNSNVIIKNIENASEFSDIIFSKLDVNNNDKFDMLNKALFSGGLFLKIPENTNAGKIKIKSTPGITRTIIVAEKNSSVEIIEDLEGDGEISSNFIDIFTEEGSKVNFYTIQNFSKNTFEISHKKAHISKNSSVNWIVGQFGCRLSRIKISNYFKGEGSESNIKGIFFGEENQHLDITTNSIHIQPKGTCNITFKGVLKNESNHVYRGNIIINKGAKETSSFLRDDSIMIGENSISNSIPALFIDENDVQCGHGASMGQVDEEKIYYLMSRGLKREDAEKLIIEGFYLQTINKIPDQEIQNKINKIISERL